MLTVKLVEPSGHEQIYEAEQVWAEPAQEPGSSHVYAAPGMDKINPIRFGGPGMLYVMNENGRTIARYVLGTAVGDAVPDTGARRQER